MTHFPLFFDLKDKDVLILGGGRLAFQRLEKLKPFGPRLRVISDHISPQIRAVDGVVVEERPFSVLDLSPPPLLVILAEDRERSALLYEECKKRHIPVNAVDMPELCDVIFPSVIATEHLCVGISSGGISPTATVELKERIGSLIPDGLDLILEWMLPVREKVKSSLPPERRNAALRKIFSLAMDKNRPLTEEELRELLLMQV